MTAHEILSYVNFTTTAGSLPAGGSDRMRRCYKFQEAIKYRGGVMDVAGGGIVDPLGGEPGANVPGVITVGIYIWDLTPELSPGDPLKALTAGVYSTSINHGGLVGTLRAKAGSSDSPEIFMECTARLIEISHKQLKTHDEIPYVDMTLKFQRYDDWGYA